MLIVLLIIACVLYKVLRFALPKLLPQNYERYKDTKGKGTWAIVTGASEGIGASFAIALAKKGFNIVLMARNEEKMNTLSEEIKQQSHVETRICPVDLSAGNDKEFWVKLVDSFKDIDIGILVNNVGYVNYLPSYIDTLEYDEIGRMINLNCYATTCLTHLVSKRMLTRTCRSAIINMSSFTSLRPSPMLQVYGATKAYIKHFSRSTAIELSSKIDITAFAPWYVCTTMTQIRRPTLTRITPDHFVREALPYVGKVDFIDPYWVHYLMDIGVGLIPGFIYNKQMISTQKFVRSRLMKKRETQ